MNDLDIAMYLDEVAEKSALAEIKWDRVNPTTFRWSQDADGQNYVTSIQKASTPSRVVLVNGRRVEQGGDIYLFQIFQRGKPEPIIALSSKERPDIQESLVRVFESVEAGMDVQAKQILSKLLGKS